MHLFLDANIYLGFFKLSGDDLEELRKLAVAVRSGDTVLYLTDQVRDEFKRNRAASISESLKVVEAAQLPKAYPRLFTNLDGYPEMRKTLESFEQQRATLLDQARTAALKSDLHADHLIRDLFEIGCRIPLSAEIRSAAETRHRLGNPPGKKDSLGDAVNWESLLDAVPERENLVLVSADRDYASRLDPHLVDEFLASEWSEVKNGRVVLYDSLTSLFKDHYPSIHLAADLERSLAIDALIASPNFRSTHLAIQKLSSFADFSATEAASLVDAAHANSQIRLILGDVDVRAFYRSLLERFGDELPEDSVAMLREALATLDEPS